MITSRRRRLEEKNARRKIAVGLIGMIALVAFLLIFGFRLLIAFSLFIEKLRGGSAAQPAQQTGNILIPPVLNPLPDATNSATLDIQGTATAKMTAVVYVNGDEYRRLTVGDDGTFAIDSIPVKEGKVTVSARLMDTKKEVSDISNTISTVIDRTPPDLTVDKPDDNATVNDGTRRVTVTGKTENDSRLTINGRIVIVSSDGGFSYNMPLNDGENTLTIVATDAAGNSIEMEKKVTYQP